MKVLLVQFKSDSKVVSVIDSLNGKFDLSVSHGDKDLFAKLDKDQYQLLVLNVGETEEESNHLLRQVSANYQKLPVLCLLNSNDESKALEVLNCGASDVLLQSELTSENFEKKVRRVMARFEFSKQIQTNMSEIVLENCFDGICAIDLKMNVLFWSRSMERLFLKKSVDTIGKSIHDLLPFGDVNLELDRAMEGESFAGSMKVFRHREQRRVYQPFYAPLLDTNSNIIGVIGIFRDLSELNEKDKQNFVINKRLEAIADTVPQMLWFANSKGEKNFFNNKFLEFTGAQPIHLLNEGWLMGVRPDQRELYQKEIADAVKQKKGFHIEYQMRNHENNYRRIMDSCAPITSDDGKFLGLIGHSTDLSETGVTVQKLSPVSETRSFSESSGRFRRINRDSISTTMENAPLGMWKIDKDLRIMSVSRAAASQLECNPSDLQGKKFTEFIKNISEKSLNEVIEEKSSFQLNAHPVDLNGLRVSKTCFWDVAAWPLLDKSKDVIGICLSTIEVGERTDDVGREAFVATLVHDLKTPLIGADRTLELLIDGSMGEVDTGQSEVLTMLQRSNRGLLRMVHNLIEVYRFDFKKPKFDFEPTSLFDLGIVCVQELKAIADEKSVVLETNLLPERGIVLLDEMSIKRVVINLIENAIKFTPPGGYVKVWGEETPNTVSLNIEDTGIGIKQDEIPMVFEKFWRSPTNSSHAVGTGLGLYLCKQIIDSHHGEISVSRTAKEGTLVRITLQT